MPMSDAGPNRNDTGHQGLENGSTFLQIPLEIRQRIYQLVFEGNAFYSSCGDMSPWWSCGEVSEFDPSQSSLLLTCHQCYDEGVDTYYSQADVEIYPCCLRSLRTSDYHNLMRYCTQVTLAPSVVITARQFPGCRDIHKFTALKRLAITDRISLVMRDIKWLYEASKVNFPTSQSDREENLLFYKFVGKLVRKAFKTGTEGIRLRALLETTPGLTVKFGVVAILDGDLTAYFSLNVKSHSWEMQLNDAYRGGERLDLG